MQTYPIADLRTLLPDKTSLHPFQQSIVQRSHMTISRKENLADMTKAKRAFHLVLRESLSIFSLLRQLFSLFLFSMSEGDTTCRRDGWSRRRGATGSGSVDSGRVEDAMRDPSVRRKFPPNERIRRLRFLVKRTRDRSDRCNVVFRTEAIVIRDPTSENLLISFAATKLRSAVGNEPVVIGANVAVALTGARVER